MTDMDESFFIFWAMVAVIAIVTVVGVALMIKETNRERKLYDNLIKGTLEHTNYAVTNYQIRSESHTRYMPNTTTIGDTTSTTYIPITEDTDTLIVTAEVDDSTKLIVTTNYRLIAIGTDEPDHIRVADDTKDDDDPYVIFYSSDVKKK